uniref:DUF4220 domain-containing protein n=1 Tax=Oryza sativa subsp. japonica TaxID=39947 RepID=Q2QX59_ORYSJ|nr:hypothetical protein LOC_Os12g07100 [Oryza sativa Japonica Group]
MRAQRRAGKKRGRGEEAGGVERARQRWRESGREAAGTAGAVGRAAGESGSGAAALVMLQLFTAGVFVVLVDLHERGRRSSGGRRAAGNYDGARGLRKNVVRQHLLQTIFVLWLIVNTTRGHNMSYRVVTWAFWSLSVFKAAAMVAEFLVGRSNDVASRRRMGVEVIARYMEIEESLAAGDQPANPRTMKGYKYIFHGEATVAPMSRDGDILAQISSSKSVVTIDWVYPWIDDQVGYSELEKDLARDICLAFTLYKLLKLRLYGYIHAAAGSQKAKDLIFARAFPGGYRLQQQLDDRPWYNRRRRHLWWKEYIAPPKMNYWEDNLGEYVLLEGFNHRPWVWNLLSWLTLCLVEPRRQGQKRGRTKHLTREVSGAVLLSFKSSSGRLTNGISTLRRHGLSSRLGWACTFPNLTDQILVWHVVTTRCDWASGRGRSRRDDDHHNRLVARRLFNYCAYLVAFVPEMLPDPSYIAQQIFDTTVQQARDHFDGCRTTSSVLARLQEIQDKERCGARVRETSQLHHHREGGAARRPAQDGYGQRGAAVADAGRVLG